MGRFKIFLVDGKRVGIVKSNEHTYNIVYAKTGKHQEVKKCYVKTYYPDVTKTKGKNKLPEQQLNLWD